MRIQRNRAVISPATCWQVCVCVYVVALSTHTQLKSTDIKKPTQLSKCSFVSPRLKESEHETVVLSSFLYWKRCQLSPQATKMAGHTLCQDAHTHISSSICYKLNIAANLFIFDTLPSPQVSGLRPSKSVYFSKRNTSLCLCVCLYQCVLRITHCIAHTFRVPSGVCFSPLPASASPLTTTQHIPTMFTRSPSCCLTAVALRRHT